MLKLLFQSKRLHLHNLRLTTRCLPLQSLTSLAAIDGPQTAPPPPTAKTPAVNLHDRTESGDNYTSSKCLTQPLLMGRSFPGGKLKGSLNGGEALCGLATKQEVPFLPQLLKGKQRFANMSESSTQPPPPPTSTPPVRNGGMCAWSTSKDPLGSLCRLCLHVPLHAQFNISWK